MEINTARAKEIEAWIRDHPDQKVQDLKAPIELSGKMEYFDVWRIPIKLLIYNIRNGRFAAEQIAKEKDLKRQLDPTVPADAKIIQTLLLEQSKKETAELKASLKEHGQIHEGIITFDGAVINANRRMAVLSQLFEETSDPKFDYLKVARLPKNVDEKDVWGIEAGLQFAKDLRLEYGPVNELLKLKEGMKKGLNEKQISHFLMGRYSEEDVKSRLRVLELIDSYLEYVGKPEEYQLVERNVEKFNSLSKNVIESLKNKGEIPKKEIPKLTLAAFSLINSGDRVTHWDIRKLRGIAKNEAAKATLLDGFQSGNLKESSLDKLVDAFNVAMEISESALDYDKPRKLAQRALVILDSIDKNSAKLREPEVRQLLEEIAAKLGELLKRSKAR